LTGVQYIVKGARLNIYEQTDRLVVLKTGSKS